MEMKRYEDGGFLHVEGYKDGKCIATVYVDLDTHGVSIMDDATHYSSGVSMPLADFKKFFKQAIREINRYEREMHVAALEGEEPWDN